MIDNPAWRTIRIASKRVVARDLHLRVDGIELLPSEGPVLLVARHFHHLYDGCAVMATVPRQVQVLVGLDWVERPIALKGMQSACRAAGWPVVYRSTAGIERSVWLSALREAMRQSVEILRDGKILLVFPEGYPTIDPHPTPKRRRDEVLPFHTGFVRIAQNALDAGIPVRTVPVGFRYDERPYGWDVMMRFGHELPIDRSGAPARFAETARRAIIGLSDLEVGTTEQTSARPY
ncbi:MAG TPA: 1-acyl-sn-glycerol-3-phosphate acyltransferase [Thermomicrobiales bacterium]|nr:1-acyl-sn-glycerol-3-phosphate acyltransferase [Thermomicrobiales bacterium]